MRDLFFLRIHDINRDCGIGWVQINVRLLRIARDISIFAKPRRKVIDPFSKARFGDRDVGKLYRRHLETFIIPARAFGIPRRVEGEGGRMMAVTRKLLFPHHPSCHSRPSHSRMAFNGDTRHFSLHPPSFLLAPTCAEPRVFHYLSQGSIVCMVLSRPG